MSSASSRDASGSSCRSATLPTTPPPSHSKAYPSYKTTLQPVIWKPAGRSPPSKLLQNPTKSWSYWTTSYKTSAPLHAISPNKISTLQSLLWRLRTHPSSSHQHSNMPPFLSTLMLRSRSVDPPESPSSLAWATPQATWPLSYRSHSLWISPNTSSAHQKNFPNIYEDVNPTPDNTSGSKESQSTRKESPYLIPLIPFPSRTSSASRMNVRSIIPVSSTWSVT